MCPQTEFESVRGEMERQAKRAAKLEQKLGLLLGGLQRRDSELGTRAVELWGQVKDAAQELACFQALRERELRAAPERLEALAELHGEQQAKERDLQVNSFTCSDRSEQ